jgi:hypothetical protein
MPLVIPDTFDLIRLLVLVGTWAIIPLHIWTYYKVMRQLQAWRDAEDARAIRWRADLATSAKILTEAQDLRHQAEVSLALARRQAMNGSRATPE